MEERQMAAEYIIDEADEHEEGGEGSSKERTAALYERERRRARRRKIRNTRIFLAGAMVFMAGFLLGCLFMGIGNMLAGKKSVTSEKGEQNIVAAAPDSGFSGKNRMGRVVVVDAGHGGSDPGSMEAEIWESEINLQMALVLQEKLERRGIEVLMTRTDGEGIGLSDRVNLANEAEADAYISIHQNSYKSSSVKGLELLYNPDKQEGGEGSLALAQALQNVLAEEKTIENRGLKENQGLQVLRTTDMPAVLVEVGYLTNPSEQKKILSEDYQALVMECIAQGVEDYLKDN